jgi:hypothetical protein
MLVLQTNSPPLSSSSPLMMATSSKGGNKYLVPVFLSSDLKFVSTPGLGGVQQQQHQDYCPEMLSLVTEFGFLE